MPQRKPQSKAVSEQYYPQEKILSLLSDELREKFPSTENGYGGSCYTILNTWDDKILVRSAWGESKDPPNFSLIPYTFSETMGASDDGDQAGKPGVELGDPIPVQIQAVPKSGGDPALLDESSTFIPTDVLAEAGKRNAATDTIHLNSIVRHALSMVNHTDLEPATKAHMHHTMNPLDGESKDPPKESPDSANSDITESWSQLAGETLTESFGQPLTEAKFDKKNLVIEGTKVLGPVSSNGRDYPIATQQAAISVFEGAKAYLNHPDPEDMAKPRKVEHLIGEHRNLRVIGDSTYSDLHLLDKPLVHNEVIPIVESKPHLAGNSIVVRARQKKNADGKVTVEEILAARSIDLVAEPGTTKGIYESQNFRKDNEMEFKDLTLEALKEHRSDLFEAITISVKKQEEAKEQVVAIESENKKLKDDLAVRDAKLAEFELKEAKRQEEEAKSARVSLIGKIIGESKIPDRVKFEDKDGRKVIKSHYANLLERCQSEDEMKALVADWEKTLVPTKPPISEGKDFSLDRAPITEDVVSKAFHAFTH